MDRTLEMDHHHEYLQPLMRGMVFQQVAEKRGRLVSRKGLGKELEEQKAEYGVEYQQTSLDKLPKERTGRGHSIPQPRRSHPID